MNVSMKVSEVDAGEADVSAADLGTADLGAADLTGRVPWPPDVFDRDCPSRLILEHLTSRWGVLTLTALLDGTLRFSELRRRLPGVSEKMLSQTLRTLERDGFVRRRAHPVIPPHVDYDLTPLGTEAARRIRALAYWTESQVEAVTVARAEYDAAH
jgi:DNA-binding HxlR family transcriptional regulator